MKLKSGVRITGLRPEMLLALVTANDVYRSHDRDLVVTSLLDGAHSRTSLHYSGCAADLRTTAAHIPRSTVEAIAADIRKALTADYDVIVEPDHIHLEFQPRRPS
jgi:hypothetical protein